MAAQSQARTSAGTRKCQAPRDLMREGNGMSPVIHPSNTGDALLLRFRRVCCPRMDRGIAVKWTPNSRKLGRGQSATVSSTWPRSVHGFVREFSEVVDCPRPQTCPQSVRELAADSTATWLSPRPANSCAVSAKRSQKILTSPVINEKTAIAYKKYAVCPLAGQPAALANASDQGVSTRSPGCQLWLNQGSSGP